MAHRLHYGPEKSHPAPICGGQAAAVATPGSEVCNSIPVKETGELWHDFTWGLEDAKSRTLPVYENGTVLVQATRENGTKATAGRCRLPAQARVAACPTGAAHCNAFSDNNEKVPSRAPDDDAVENVEEET